MGGCLLSFSRALTSRSHTGQVNLGANRTRSVARDLMTEAALGQGHRQTSFAAIMRAFHHAGPDQRPEPKMQFFLFLQIASRRSPNLEPVHALEIRRATQPEQRISRINDFPQEDDRIPFILEPFRRDM